MVKNEKLLETNNLILRSHSIKKQESKLSKESIMDLNPNFSEIISPYYIF